MVESQKDSIYSEVMTMYQKHAVESLKKTRQLPDEMVKQAQRRVTGYYSLKGEINEEMTKVRESIKRVRDKIKANVQNEQNPHGLLTSDNNDYLQCLEMNHGDFERLLGKDEAKWA